MITLFKPTFKWYHDNKNHFIFFFKFWHLTVKVLSFDFYSKAVYFECTVSFGFHGLPLVTVKTDQLDLWGLDLGIIDVIYSVA